jgi:predicted GNAT family N-acyltransferase
MKLQLAVSFPLIGAFTCTVRIVWTGLATSAGKDVLAVGVEFVQVTPDMRQTMAQYLIQFSNVDSLSELRKFGLNPQSLLGAVEFYFIKTEQDYLDVLELRRLAHEAAGNIEVGKYSDEDMGDINDARSRIVVGKFKGKVIATARLHFNTRDEQMEHERYVKWPANLPRRDQIIEVSRAATHPDFRQSDLLVGLLQYLAATTRHEKPYFVMGSWPSMIGFYKKLGFEETGLSHSEPLWDKEQHIMIADAFATLLCKGISPIYWNLMWRPVAEHMLRIGILEPTDAERVRIWIYRCFAPIARLFALMRQRPRRSRRKK